MSTRRTFMAAATGGGSLVRMAFGQASERKLKLGLIGAGWYGMVDVNAAWKAGGAEVTAICDVDSEHARAAADECEKKQGSRPKTVKDYRELIATPGLDAVIIGTPPQWHALPFIEACAKGLPVYCEKPIAYDIREAQAMIAAWRKAGNIVQIGFQRRQPNGFKAAREFVQSGQAGRIVQVDAQIHYRAGVLDTKPQDPPASLDWDTWCGPAAKLPYCPNIAHRAWRLEKEYGNGHLVDWGIHLMDAVRVILAESAPRSVIANGGLYEYGGKITTPDTLTAHFEFEKCPVVWRHRLWGAAEYSPEAQNGIFLYGDKATVFATDNRWEILPRGGKPVDRKVMQAPEAAQAQERHVGNFLQAVREKGKPMCTPDDGALSAVTVQLAMISYYSGSKVQWDSRKWEIVNNPAAARLLKREYRRPYVHPYKA